MDQMRNLLRVAVIGAGPSGIFATDNLLRSRAVEAVDIYDKLPAPYGLVRYGVAPDHFKIKSVAQKFRKILGDDRVRFFGNVEYGTDISRCDLDSMYHTTVVSAGAPGNRRLEIPGEDLSGSVAASAMVSWYNGHPDVPETFDIRGTSVAIIGAGNVSLDIARILFKSTKELAETDVPEHVLSTLEANAVDTIHIVARRGPESAKFSLPELLEFDSLPDVDIVVDRCDLPESSGELPVAVAMTLDVFRRWADTPVAPGRRKIHFHFWKEPSQITGTTSVNGITLESARPRPSTSINGDTSTLLDVTMVIRSIGFKGVRLADLPFDERSATIPNIRGRILDDRHRAGMPWYVTGWLKRGPQGIIGTNKLCAVDTVKTLLSDASDVSTSVIRHDPAGPARLLAEREIDWVSKESWDRIDAYEVAQGRRAGRARVKIVRRDDLLAARTI